MRLYNFLLVKMKVRNEIIMLFTGAYKLHQYAMWTSTRPYYVCQWKGIPILI